MIPRFTLRRKVECKAWTFVGEVAFAAERKWELAILKLAAEQDDRIDAEQIDRDLLGGGRRSVAERLIGVLRDLKLLDSKSELTEQGRRATDQGVILVPQRGLWKITYTDDNLLPSHILRIEAFEEPSANDEAKNGKGKGKEQDARSASIPAPNALKSLENVEVQEILSSLRLVRLESIHGNKVSRTEPDVDVDIVVEYRQDMPPGVKVLEKGAGPKRAFSIPNPGRLAHEVDWFQLLASCSLGSYWNTDLNHLNVGFDSIQDSERATKQRSLTIEEPQLEAYGSFDRCVVRDVPIHPASSEDAELWTKWFLERSITELAVESKYSQWQRDAESHFPEWSVQTPSRSEMLAIMAADKGVRRNSKAWYLQAALDWEL